MTPSSTSTSTPPVPITVDDRAGSDELGRLLLKRKQPVVMGRLEFGDVAFLGVGKDGRPVPVGIEFKRVSDVLQCVCNGRYAAHQLPGMLDSYEMVYLLVEGRVRRSYDGLLQVQHPVKQFWYNAKVGPRRFAHRDLHKWLMTMQMHAGVRVLWAADLEESASQVTCLYDWWVRDGWDHHKSSVAIRSPIELDRVNIVRPNLVRRVASCLPGVGGDRSAAVARKFPTVIDLVLAQEADWIEIDGIGKKTAAAVVAAIQGTGGAK